MCLDCTKFGRKRDIFSERFEDLLRTYYFVGGMPEAVSLFSQNSDFVQVRRVHEDILSAYRRDFTKHAGNVVGERCRMVFESLPRHLAKENKKFVYGVFKKGFRGRELDDALQFLQDTRSYKCRALLAFRISRGVVDDKRTFVRSSLPCCFAFIGFTWKEHRYLSRATPHL